jgi:diacylglycerol kinase family enzyme
MTKVLLISNPTARATEHRVIEQVTQTLTGRFTLEMAESAARDDSTRLARDAVTSGFDAVIALGGDGTVNEVAQALVHTDVALGIIPAGTTNVMARSLGIPPDPRDASAFLASRLDRGGRRRINVGRIGARYFLFGAGMGLDAEVIRAVEERPEKKRRLGHLFFLQQALVTAGRHRSVAPTISMTVEGSATEMVALALCANAGPFTYFGKHPLHVFPHVDLREGLDVFGLSRIGWTTVPRLGWAFLVTRSHIGWPTANYHHDVGSVELRAAAPVPVEVDGDYIGEWDQASVRLIPQALELLL